MLDHAPFLPGLSALAGKPVHLAIDGGRLTSDAGVLVVVEIQRRLGLAEQLTACIEDPRAVDWVRHGLAEMIRSPALLIAAGSDDANDCDALRADPAFSWRSVSCRRPGSICTRSRRSAGSRISSRPQ